MQKRIAVVGCGLTGAVIARILAERGEASVDIFEQRPVIAGNVFDSTDPETGYFQKYGPHFFHTTNECVWKFLSRFTQWLPYKYYCVGKIDDGRIVPLPPNFNTIRMLYPDMAQYVSQELTGIYGFGTNVNFYDIFANPYVSGKTKDVIERLYQLVFVTYSRKQWKNYFDEMHRSMGSRFKIRLNCDNSYFTDPWQALPTDSAGCPSYTNMVQNIVAHEKIHVETGCTLEKSEVSKYELIFHTGAIDDWYNGSEGVLDFLSLEWDCTPSETNLTDFPACNHLTEDLYTRTMEYWKMSEIPAKKLAFHERSVVGGKERFYPIPNSENLQRYARYCEMAKADKIIFCGRIGGYEYLNMDLAVAKAMTRAISVLSNR